MFSNRLQHYFTNTMSQAIPPTCKALVCSGLGEPLKVESVSTPTATSGSAVVHLLASQVLHTHKDILSGKHSHMRFPLPLIPGSRAVGRVAATGVDAASLQVGQLVLVEPFVRGRDDPNVQILLALSQMFSPSAKRFAENAWRDGLWTEYAQVPLENCHALNEKILLGSPADGGLEYDITDLSELAGYAIAYGGLRSMDLKAGETVIVAPATGSISGAAVAGSSSQGTICKGRSSLLIRVYSRICDGGQGNRLVAQHGRHEGTCSTSPSGQHRPN